jgi:putative DNA primase/helicase
VLASARKIVSEIVPLIGTAGEVYLRDVRKIDVAAIEDVLAKADAIGWHPSVYFNEPGHALRRRKLGCIVAIMTDAVTAEPTGAISRTYLRPDLTKIGKAKTFGAPRGIVRLSPDGEVLEGLHLAEGIETALTGLSWGFRPMWSTGDCRLMEDFPLLSGIEALTVFVDNDENAAGEKAARKLEAR